MKMIIISNFRGGL